MDRTEFALEAGNAAKQVAVRRGRGQMKASRGCEKDAFQEGAVRALEVFARFDPLKENVRGTYARSCGVRAALDLGRKDRARANRQPLIKDFGVFSETGGDDPVLQVRYRKEEEARARTQVDEILRGATARQREILWALLQRLAEDDESRSSVGIISDTAAMLGVTPNAISCELARLRRKRKAA